MFWAWRAPASACSTVSCGSGLLWPDDFLFSSSMVLLLNYEQSSVLLEGDAERAVERRIAVPYHPNADLLRAVKVTTAALLRPHPRR